MTDNRGLNWPLLVCIATCLILAAPLWCVTSVPMPDYPAHVASYYLINGGASHYYRVEWAFLPNLAGEAIIPLLGKLVPLEIAAKLYLSVTIALWTLGPAAIQRALFGKVGLGGVIAAAFAYNAPFMWGFFNYTFAAGLSFFVFAAWVATDGKRKPLQLAGLALAVTLVYFAHLFALATLLLLIGCFELSYLFKGGAPFTTAFIRRMLDIAIAFLPAALLYLFLAPHGDGLDVEFNLLDTMVERFEAAIQFHFDLPAYVATGTLVLVFIAGVLTRHFAIAPRMKIGLVVLLVCTILAPEWALGGWGVHFRLPAVLGAMAFASSDIRLERKWLISAGAAMVAFFIAQATVLTASWQRLDARYREFRATESQIKRGTRLLTVLDGDSLGWSADQPYWHMAEFAIMDRGAFVPLLFTTKGQHVIEVMPPMKPYAAANAQQGSPPDIDELNDLAAGRAVVNDDSSDAFPNLEYFQCHFDQAIVIHGDGALSKIPPMLKLSYRKSFFAVYDIIPDRKCSKP